MSAHSAEKDAWDFVPWNGVHEFKPWTVMPGWLAPGCSCCTIRSAGPSTESEASMREWWNWHMATVIASDKGDQE